MITIIHGEDISKSRKYFIEQRQAYTDAVSLAGQTMTLTDVMQVFEGGGLFAEEKYIFIEDFFGKKKAGKETDAMIAVMNQNQDNAKIYLWEGKDMTPAQIKKFPKAIVSQFKIPQMLFTFLDAIQPHNSIRLLQLFHQTLQDEDVQLLFVMLIRQFRLLLALANPGTDAISEIKRMAPWQKGKLQKQAGLFGQSALLHHYAALYDMERGLKTGSLPLSLEQAIDFFLLGL